MANQQQMEDKAKDMASDAKDKLKDMASDAKDKTEDIGRTIINKSIDASNNFSEVVKANPYKSLTIAFLCGWVIAKL